MNEDIRKVGSVACNLIDAALSAGIPLALTKLMQTTIEGKNFTLLGNSYKSLTVLQILIFLTGIKGLLPIINSHFFIVQPSSDSKIITDELINKIFTLSYEDLEEVNQLSVDIQRWESQHSYYIPDIYKKLIPSLSNLIVNFGLTTVISGSTGLLFSGAMAATKFLLKRYLVFDCTEQIQTEIDRHIHNSVTLIFEYISNKDDIQLARMADFQKEEITDIFDKIRALNTELQKQQSNYSAYNKSWYTILISSLMLFVCRDGFFIKDIGEFIFFFNSIETLALDMDDFTNEYNAYQKTLQFIKNAQKVIQQHQNGLMSTKIPLTPSTQQNSIRPNPTIQFINVTIRFAQNNYDTIADFNLNIPTGKTIALAGKSGSGKTVLVKVLSGLCEISSGYIKIDGIDIRDIPKEILWSAIGYCKQDFYSASKKSVLFNVLYDKDNINILKNLPAVDTLSPSEKRKVLKAASLLNDVCISSDKHNQPFNQLSEGQKQRVNLAKTLLKNSSIFIFDEPTANLDATTEATIMRKIRQKTNGKTTIIIAHRLPTIRYAHSICFFGKLNRQIVTCKTYTSAEVGNHQTLMTADNGYADAYKLITS